MRLRPLSIWHEALLDAADSPFAQKLERKPLPPASDRQALFAALYQALEICRLRPPHLPRPDSFLAIRRRRSALRKFYFSRTSKLDLLREQLKLLAYLGDYRSQPIYGQSNNTDGEPIRSPHWLYQVALFKRFNHDIGIDPVQPSSVWELSPGFISWQNAAAQEAHGMKIQILTEAHLTTIARASKKKSSQPLNRRSTSQPANG